MEIRAIRQDEVDEFLRSDSRAFGWQLPEELLALYRQTVEPERSLAAFDDGQMVGVALWQPFDLGIPGGTMDAAGIASVGVHPTHRRRGLLTRMMKRQLTEFHEAGIPLACLTASESIIYGRFGYGIASFNERWTIERQHTSYARPFEAEGRLSFVTPDRAKDIFPEIERRAISGRPGAVLRPETSWSVLLADPEIQRRGASAYFHVLYERDGRPEGFTTYRLKDETVLVDLLMAATDDAHAALWRYCFDIDLRTTTTAHTRAVDDPLPWMLADPRRLKREVYEGLWLRLVDAPQALSGRSYAREESLVLGLVDSFCPWNQGTFELEASGAGARCSRSTKNPDLVLTAADLAVAYLGTEAFSALARAGRVEERAPRALARADAMFAHRPLPWCPYEF